MTPLTITPFYTIGSIVLSVITFVFALIATGDSAMSDEQHQQDVIRHILSSNLYIIIHINTVYVLIFLLGRMIMAFFVGKVRRAEFESFQDKMVQYALLNLLFIFYVLNPSDTYEILLLVTWFTAIGFLKVFAIVGRDRCNFVMSTLERSMAIQAKLLIMLGLVLIADLVLLLGATVVTLSAGIGPLLLINFECWMLLLDVLGSLVPFGMFTFLTPETWAASQDMIFKIDFIVDMLSLLSKIGHYVHIWKTNNFNISILEMWVFVLFNRTATNIRQRIQKFRGYLNILNLINNSFSNATQEDIDHYGESCAICLEDMQAGSSTKKMDSCGHAFHTSCLIRWMQTGQHTCPVCRVSVTMNASPNQTPPPAHDDVAAPPHPSPSTEADQDLPFASLPQDTDNLFDVRQRRQEQDEAA